MCVYEHLWNKNHTRGLSCSQQQQSKWVDFLSNTENKGRASGVNDVIVQCDIN